MTSTTLPARALTAALFTLLVFAATPFTCRKGFPTKNNKAIVMMRRAITLIALIFTMKAVGQEVVWTTVFSDGSFNRGNCIEVNDSLLIVGSGDGKVLRFNQETGDFLSVFMQNGAGQDHNIESIETLSNGMFLATKTQPTYQIGALIFDELGSEFVNLNNGQSSIHFAEELSNGNLYFSAWKNCGGLGGGWDTRVFSTSPDGNSILWEEFFCVVCGCPGGGFCNLGDDLVLGSTSINDFIYTTGNQYFGGTGCYGDNNMYLLQISPQGELVNSRIIGEEGEDRRGYSIAASSSGLVSVGSKQVEGQEENIYLVGLDFNLDVVWEREIVFDGNEKGKSIIPCSNGGYYILAEVDGIEGKDALLLKIDDLGNVEWEVLHDTPGIDDFLPIHDALDVDSSGYIYFTYRSGDYVDGGLVVVKVAPQAFSCADPTACNFEQEGDCVYPEPNFDCAGNCLNDINNNGVCDELECFEEVTIDVVLGESVTLMAFDPFQSSTLIWSNQMTFSGPSSITTPLLSEGVSYRLDVNGFYDITTSAYGLKDAAWYFCYFGCGCSCDSENPAPLTAEAMNGEIIPIELRPTPDVYNPNHFYEYFFQGDGSVMNFSFTDGLYADNSGLLSFSLFELSSSDFTWSNGAMGPSVTITPTESMSYEVAIAGDLGEFCTGVYFVNVLNPGCTDEGACNYDIAAEVDNQTCVYPEPNLDCAGNCLNDADGDGVCDELEILGCTDTMACNYMVEATDDDASCTYPAEPYLDCEGNCLNDANNNGVCDELDVPGCTFEGACNYNPEATVNDNSCFFATAVFDCNGNCQQDANNNGICDQLEAIGAQLCGEGTVWDNSVGTCIGFDPCPADLNDSGVVDVADLLIFLTLFGENCE